MSAAQRRALALWAALLSALVCLAFLPVSRAVSFLILLIVLALIAAAWHRSQRRSAEETLVLLDTLPGVEYRLPVVLVCGDLAQAWPVSLPVLTVAQGCWIRVDEQQDLSQLVRQLLCQRPDWGRQLSVMVNVCPQQHDNSDAFNSRLLALRWQISQLRRATGYAFPLVLNGQVGSAMLDHPLWQAALPGEAISVWRTSSAPCSIAAWATTSGALAMQQQVLMNGLMTWFHQHVNAIFQDENPEIPVIAPAVVLWGIGPGMTDGLASSLWTDWLTRHTGLQQVDGWLPVQATSTVTSLFPDDILPLLPAGQGLTPRQRTAIWATDIFILALVAALLSSASHNSQLLRNLSMDIAEYHRIPMNAFAQKAAAVSVLRQDLARLDKWARNGEPVNLGLGLYQGERLRQPLTAAIRAFIPAPVSVTPSTPTAAPDITLKQVPTLIRLDSLSLFDSGSARLKPEATKMLVSSLMNIRAKPGWLIVVAGHTDNTGNRERNQTLSVARAAAVRDWMRDTGDVPENCFAVQGLGESRPVATNDTPEGRARNRRVEISLVPQAEACLMPDHTQVLSQDDGANNNLTE